MFPSSSQEDSQPGGPPGKCSAAEPGALEPQAALELLEDLDAIVWEADVATWRFTYVSRQAERILGYPLARWRDEPLFWLEMIHPEDRESAAGYCRDCTAAGRDHAFEYRVVTADGRVRWVCDVVHVVRDQSGSASSLRGVMVDITDWKHARASAQEREQQLKLVADSVPALLSYIGTDFRYQRVNRVYEEWFGLGVDQVRGRHVREVLGEAAWEALRPEMARAAAGEQVTFERQVDYRQAGKRWIRATYTPDRGPGGQVRGFVVLVTDIGERRRAEEALRDSEHQYRELIKALPAALYTCDAQGRVTYFNDAAAELWGRTPALGTDMWCGSHRLYLVDGTPLPLDQCLMAIAIREQRPVRGQELVVERPDGTRRHILPHPRPLRDAAGRVIGGLNLIADITDLRQAQDGMRASQERLRIATEAGRIGTWEWDIARDRVVWSDLLLEMHGLTPEEFGGTGEAAMRVLYHEDVDPVLAAVQSALERGESFTTEYRARGPGGVMRWFWTRAKVQRSADGRPVRIMGATLDITDRKQAEESLARHRDHLDGLVRDRTGELERTHQRLRLSERLASIGTLSAGLGHDLGNLLLPVRSRLESLRSRDLPVEAQEDLEAIARCVEYLGRMTGALRVLAQDPEKASAGESVHLSEWWRDVEALFRTALPCGAVLTARMDAGLPEAAIGRTALTQAIFNLVQNAGQALRDRADGKVEVWAEPGQGGVIRIGVTDNGPGMSEEVKRHCFEPFFTTQTRRLSTGLGLALVHGLVQSAGGRISVESEPMRGATFVLELRIATARPGPETEQDSPAVVSIRDDRLQALVRALVQASGHAALQATDPNGLPRCSLWVTDFDDGVLERAEAMIASGQVERAVVLGGPDGAGNGKLVCLPRPFSATALRQALLESASAGV